MKPEKTKKRNIKKIIIIVLCILAVIAVAGYFIYDAVMYYIGDTVMREMVKNEIETALENGSITEDELRVMAGEVPSPSPVTEAESAEAENPADSASVEDPTAPAKSPDGETLKPQQQKPQQQKPQEKPKMTAEEKKTLVNKATDNIASFVSRDDKVAMAKLITSRLSSSDISYLAGLINGGLTREERSAAYEIAVARFQGEELAEVSRFYHKYKAQIMIEPDLVAN